MSPIDLPLGTVVVVDGCTHRFEDRDDSRVKLVHVASGAPAVAAGADGVLGPAHHEHFGRLLAEGRIFVQPERNAPHARLIEHEVGRERKPTLGLGAVAERAARRELLDAACDDGGRRASDRATGVHRGGGLPVGPSRSRRREPDCRPASRSGGAGRG